MEIDWNKAAKDLTDDDRIKALNNLLDTVNDTQAGIIRQILGDEEKLLSDKQQSIYDGKIEPALVEYCGCLSCKTIVVTGNYYCPSCEIEYGGS